ncbi:hypothetical protein C8N30_2419 [Sulfitobacter guttiformis]|uniref:Argininosuccinate lyase n=1 Tax=Sulfitobacter guttiformis TaxID=74349 RepID=A0A420DUD9_9RHOB|nr:hypothetical protein C8N30_2419 [Sulfitobacter guttiformis]
MKYLTALLVVALAACGPPDRSAAREVSPRQEPSNTTPGVHVSGSATVGVVRRF